MTAQVQGIDRYVSEIKLELFRQIDRLSYEELVGLAEQFNLEIELDEIDEEAVDPRDLAFEPISFKGDIDEGYSALAADKEDEREAKEWEAGVLNTEEL